MSPHHTGHPGPRTEDADRLARGEKRLEAVAACLIASIVGCAILGVLGRGPLSSAHRSDETGLEVRYDRFVRCRAPARLSILVPTGHDAALSWVRIDRAYLDQAEVRAITPPPDRTRASRDSIELGYEPGEPGSPLWVILDLDIKAIGPIEGLVSGPGGPGIRVSQWAYP